MIKDKYFEKLNQFIKIMLYEFRRFLKIIIVLFGASVGGILGMVFAVPITAILKVTTEELVIGIK